jgi:hypothetical protein
MDLSTIRQIQEPYLSEQAIKARQAQLSAFMAAMGQPGGLLTPAPNGGGTMLEKLKNLTGTLALKGAVDALVELAAYGRALRAEYEAQKIPGPKWLEESLVTLQREIRARWQAERRAQLVAAERELEELQSREEKRKAKEEEIKRLREELGE